MSLSSHLPEPVLRTYFIMKQALDSFLFADLGWKRFLIWLIFTQHRIPRDKLSRSLEYDSSIMEVLPGWARNWYLSVQDRRRLQSANAFWARSA